MIAGQSWLWWAGFHVAVVLLLVADGWLSRGRARSPWVMPLALGCCAAGFAGWIALAHGRQLALEWVAGYAVEVSLSVDNLFVFMVLFHGFEIGPARQRKALLWGVAGAMVLRALFIATGITLLRNFDWISWILGGFLLYAAWRLVRGRSAQAMIPGWVRKLQPVKDPLRGSLLPVILAIEATDLLFAADSIPAVLAVTRNPFIAYTSNIAAILGLRTLYLALASMLDRFRSLHYGLAAILAFVGLKMLASRWIAVPIGVSLAILGAILAVCAVASLNKAVPGS